MGYTEKTVPQQFRIVWKSNGEIQGCDFSFKKQVFKDDELFTEKIMDTMPVAFGIEDALHAMKLSDVMDGINPQLILNASNLQDKLTKTELDFTKSLQVIEALTADKNTLIAENENLIELVDVKDFEINELKTLIKNSLNADKADETKPEELQILKEDTK